MSTLTRVDYIHSFAVLVLVWLVAMAGGVLFKRYMLGAKGWEQVPLIDWYKAFGNLQAVRSFLVYVRFYDTISSQDGCDLVFRTRSPKLVEYVSVESSDAGTSF